MLLYIDRNNEEARGQLDRVREVAAALEAGPAAVTSAAVEPDLEFPEPPLGSAVLVTRQDSDELVPAPQGLSSEFQLPSDAETLVPSDDRLEEVELMGEVPEFDLPHLPPEVEEPDLVLAAGDFSASTEFELSPPEEEHASASPPVPTANEEPAEPEDVPPPVEAAPAVLEMPVPIVEVQPPPPPPPEPAAEEPAPVESEPELVVTETMAEIFLRQGHRELALAVYAQLAQRDPENGRVAEAYAALQAELAPPPPPAPEVPPAPQYAASATGGTSVREMFQVLLTASRPVMAPGLHPPAFESPRRPTGEPTRPAQDTLSLSAVFGDEPAPSRPAGTPPAPVSGEPTFDEFFTPGDGAEAELPKAGPPGATAPSQVPEDLEQFNAWLRGLKR
jgi:hypothetical protein